MAHISDVKCHYAYAFHMVTTTQIYDFILYNVLIKGKNEKQTAIFTY